MRMFAYNPRHKKIAIWKHVKRTRIAPTLKYSSSRTIQKSSFTILPFEESDVVEYNVLLNISGYSQSFSKKKLKFVNVPEVTNWTIIKTFSTLKHHNNHIIAIFI